MARRTRPVDHAARESAKLERQRNVIVDAGAGTGKTTLLVARVLELVAPANDKLPALPLERVAAITFTRRAAGELKLRLRATLLETLAKKVSKKRSGRLQVALSQIDVAYIGTVHSFADRLLRLFPERARMSPDYEILEDVAGLEAELISRLQKHAADESLSSVLRDDKARALATEVEKTLLDFSRAGLRTETATYEFSSSFGLDRLVADMIQTRDRALTLPDPPDEKEVRARAHTLERLFAEAATLGAELTGESKGGRNLSWLLERLERVHGAGEEFERLRFWNGWKREFKQKKILARDCKGEPQAWDGLKWLRDGVRGSGKDKKLRGEPLVNALDREIGNPFMEGVLVGRDRTCWASRARSELTAWRAQRARGDGAGGRVARAAGHPRTAAGCDTCRRQVVAASAAEA